MRFTGTGFIWHSTTWDDPWGDTQPQPSGDNTTFYLVNKAPTLRKRSVDDAQQPTDWPHITVDKWTKWRTPLKPRSNYEYGCFYKLTMGNRRACRSF